MIWGCGNPHEERDYGPFGRAENPLIPVNVLSVNINGAAPLERPAPRLTR